MIVKVIKFRETPPDVWIAKSEWEKLRKRLESFEVVVFCDSTETFCLIPDWHIKLFIVPDNEIPAMLSDAIEARIGRFHRMVEKVMA